MSNDKPKGTVAVLGIDLAKQSFQIHGVDVRGQVVIKKKLTRNKVGGYIAQLPKCLIGVEACSGSNYWRRMFERLGHEVRMVMRFES